MDGGILFETDKPIDEIQKIRFFNNTFLVINRFQNINKNIKIEEIIERTNLDNHEFLKYIDKRSKTFRIFSSIENSLISVDKKILGSFENNLEKITKLRIELSKIASDVEFWFLLRSEGEAFFMLRITKNKKKTIKGELRPELANVLCLMSNPTNNDVVLDPFCGSGSIALERSRIAGYRGIFACDIDENCTIFLKKEIKKINNKKLNKSFFIKKLDFFKNSFDDGYFTNIITDPPWGFYEKIKNIEEFYKNILLEFYRVLKINGRVVLLTANKEITDSILDKMSAKFKILNIYDILVSGKKARILVIEKIS